MNPHSLRAALENLLAEVETTAAGLSCTTPLAREQAHKALREHAECTTVRLALSDIPADFPVRPLRHDQPAASRYTCGTCGLAWDNAIITRWTPTPGGRCPFEYYHKYV